MFIRKRILNKVLAVTLLFVTSISLIVNTSYAAGGEGDVNSGSSGSEVAGSWSQYAHRFFAYPQNQGIRMYLVKESGELASDAIDILIQYPWEINKWTNFDGAPRSEYEQFKYSFGWSSEARDSSNKLRNSSKETRFVYLTGTKTTGLFETISYGVMGIRNKADRIGGGDIRYIKLDDFNRELGKKFGGAKFVPPSNLVGGHFFNGGQIINDFLKSRTADNKLGAQALVDLKLEGLFGEDDNLPRHNVYNNANASGTGVYLFNLLDANERQLVDTGQKQISTIMREKKYKLALEPLYYIVPELLNTDPGYNIYNRNYSYSFNIVMYGTASSILKAVKELVTDEYNFSSSGPFRMFLRTSTGEPDLSKIFVGGDWNTGNLGVSTFQTEREEKFGVGTSKPITISKFDSVHDIHFYGKDYYSLQKLTGGINENTAAYQGYGIMFYNLDDIGTSTSTFDEKTYGSNYREGAAPQTTNDDGTFPSEYPSEGTAYKTANRDHKFRIVKFYREIDGDGNKTCLSNFVRENTVHNINIVDESGYKVDGWFTGDSNKVPTSPSECYDTYKSSIPNIQGGGSAGSVVIPPDSIEKTLYVVLTKRIPRPPKQVTGTASKLFLEQDELAYTYSFSDIRTLYSVGHKIPYRRTITKRNVSMDKSSYNYEVVNTENYGNTNYIGYRGNFAPKETGTVSISGDIDYSISGRTLRIPSQRLADLSPNLMFSVYRDKSTDRVTLYPKYNDTVKSELTQIGITNVSYSPAQNRVGRTTGSGYYTSQFRATYGYKVKDGTIKYSYDIKRSGGSYDTVSRSFSISEGVGVISKLRSYYNTGITTKYYLGEVNNGVEEPKRTSRERFVIGGKQFGGNLYYDYSKVSLGFYPFTRMRYHTVADTSNKFAFVTSTNKSIMYGVTAVDSGVYRSNPSLYGIDVQSTQWSTHTKAVDGLARILGSQVQPSKSLIPGGATVDLKSSNTSSEASEIWLGFRTYQVCLPDTSYDAYIDKTGIDKTSDALAKGKAFADEVKTVVTGYRVEKFAKEGIVKESGFTGITKVYPSGTFAGKQLSGDGKYYLRDGVGTSQSNSLDIIGEEPVTQVTYKVYKNSANNLLNSKFGVITVERDGAVIASGNKTEVLSNLEVKSLDSRTKVITNLNNALDNGGTSADRNNQNWYYEGNEPIEVVMTTFAYQIGFGGANTVRSEVVDPKLVGTLDNKGDLLNFEDDKLNAKTRTIQYKLSSGSANAMGNGANYMGTFNNIKVVIPGMTDVFKSRLHYMGNNTVQDLN